MSTQVEFDELYRLSTDDYHRLAESGVFEDLPSCELIDGLLVRKEMRSREHEDAIAWLNRWLMFGVDQERYEVRVGAAITLDTSEPEPDLMVIERDGPRPYHPGTAALAIEVSVSSLRRDLQVKSRLYARAMVAEYWVFDIHAARVVVHRVPRENGYGAVSDVRAGGRITAPAGLPELDVDELVGSAG